MARHYWNSTPPRLWPIVRFAAERGWAITIVRPNNASLTVLLQRRSTDPILFAEWRFHTDNYLPAIGAKLGRGHVGRWRFYTAHTRSLVDRHQQPCSLGDVTRLLLEADHRTSDA